MKITRTVQFQEEFTPSPYMKSVFAWFRFKAGKIIRVSNSMISVRDEIFDSDINDGLKECTETEFNAAYERTVQNIREAYLS